MPRLDMCRSMLSLSKIAHQMWCDHSFSQRNMTTERTVGVGSWRWQGSGGRGTKFEEGRGRQYRGDLHKIGGLASLCQLFQETLKISNPQPFLALPISSKNFPSTLITAIFEKSHPLFMKEGFDYELLDTVSTCVVSMIYICSNWTNYFKFDLSLAGNFYTVEDKQKVWKN